MKQEIAEKDAQALSLARWKLVVVAVLCVAGLGWGDIEPGTLTGVLILYSVGFLCSYLDLLIYRRLLIIQIIASYLRGYDGTDDNLLEERRYELYLEQVRSIGLPLSERYGHLLSSIVFTAGSAFLAFLVYAQDVSWVFLMPVTALSLNIVLFVLLESGRKRALAVKVASELNHEVAIHGATEPVGAHGPSGASAGVARGSYSVGRSS